MMEHTALNGTASSTTIIKDQEEWKQKKGYGPSILFAVLLLGGAFYAGQSRGTIRGATTAASPTMMSTDAKYMVPPGHVATNLEQFKQEAEQEYETATATTGGLSGANGHLTCALIKKEVDCLTTKEYNCFWFCDECVTEQVYDNIAGN